MGKRKKRKKKKEKIGQLYACLYVSYKNFFFVGNYDIFMIRSSIIKLQKFNLQTQEEEVKQTINES
jgi:hypothetical protein